jgi:acetoin utilization protein AcuB
MKVGNYMTPEPVTLSEDESMGEALMLMRRHNIRHLPVVNGSILVGIVTDRDLRRASPSLLSGIAEERYQEVLDGTSVARIMTREPFTVRLDTDLDEAVGLLVEKKLGSLPVVNGAELVGIFTEVDALRVLLDVLKKIKKE